MQDNNKEDEGNDGNDHVRFEVNANGKRADEDDEGNDGNNHVRFEVNANGKRAADEDTPTEE